MTRFFCLLQNIQAQPATYPVGAGGDFSSDKVAGGVELTAYSLHFISFLFIPSINTLI
jgi:hypothetical protein